MGEQINQMTAERNLAKPLVTITIVLIISGYFSLFWPDLSVFEQWTYLIHTLLGIIVTVLLGATSILANIKINHLES